MVSFPGIPQANDPGFSAANSLLGNLAQNRTTLQQQKSKNMNDILTALLGQVGTGLRESFDDKRDLKADLEKAAYGEQLPSSQALTKLRGLNALNTGVGLVGTPEEAAGIGQQARDLLGLGGGTDSLGGAIINQPTEPQYPPDFKSELLPGATPPQNDQGAFQVGVQAEEPIANSLSRPSVPIAFQKKEQDLKTAGSLGKYREAQTKAVDYKNRETQRGEEFVYGTGNQTVSQSINRMKEGESQAALDRAGQPIEGLNLTPELISRRKSFEVARKQNGKLMADGVKAIDATEILLNDYVPAVEAAIRAREKGFNLTKDIQSRTVQTSEGLVRTFVSQSNDPDVLALVTYMNSVPALATPVAKTAGEDRLTNEDIVRFSNLMGDANLSSEALRNQSQFFLRKLLLQGGNIAAVVGDQRFSRFNQVNEQLFDKPITIGNFNINSDQIKNIKGTSGAPVYSNIGGGSKGTLDLSNIDDLI